MPFVDVPSPPSRLRPDTTKAWIMPQPQGDFQRNKRDRWNLPRQNVALTETLFHRQGTATCQVFPSCITAYLEDLITARQNGETGPLKCY